VAWKKKLAAPALLIGALFFSWIVFYTLGSTLETMTAPDAKAAPAPVEKL
jgi:hypothetical protein